MSSLLERNAKAVEQALSEMDARVRAQQIRIDGLVATVGTVVGRMEALERMVLLAKAASTGTGPTAR